MEWVCLGDLLEMKTGDSNEKMLGEGLGDQEFLEYAGKIKSLVRMGEEERAIDLIRSLNEPKLYSELLKGCSIKQTNENYEKGKVELSDWFCKYSEERNYQSFFLHLIGNCPKEACVDPSLRREKVTHLDLWSFLPSKGCFSKLTNLTSLSLHDCMSLTSVDCLSGLSNLEDLIISDCNSLTNLGGLSDLTNLDYLLCRGDSLTNVDPLTELTNLTALDLGGSSLVNLDCLNEMTDLESLGLQNCSSLTNLDFLSGMPHLESLELSNCTSLTNLDCLSELSSLVELDIYGCSSLKNIDGLKDLNLCHLSIRSCSSLRNDQVEELMHSKPDWIIDFLGFETDGA